MTETHAHKQNKLPHVFIYAYPDITVSCDVDDRRRGNKLLRSPRLVIEVLPGLLQHPRDPPHQPVRPTHRVYHSDQQNHVLWNVTLYAPEQEVILESLDIHLTFDEVYQDIDFNGALIEE